MASQSSGPEQQMIASSPRQVAGSLPKAFVSSLFGSRASRPSPSPPPSGGSIGTRVPVDADSAPPSTIAMSSDSEEASSEDEPGDQTEPKLADKGSLPTGVARVYYDYSADCLMRMYDSGRTSPGKGSNGPKGFRTFTWSDGQTMESEEVNTLPVHVVPKKPAGCCKKTAAHKADEEHSAEETNGDHSGSDGEDDAETIPAMVCLKRPATIRTAAAAEAASGPTEGGSETKTAAVSATAKRTVKPAPASSQAPWASAKAETQPVAADLQSQMFSSQSMYLTLATNQSYIQGRVVGEGSKKLIVGISNTMHENHKAIIQSLHDRLKALDRHFSKFEAVEMRRLALI